MPEELTPQDAAVEVQIIRTLASMLSERSSLASKAGLTFGGNRDLFEVLGYRKTLAPEDYKSRYLRGDIATRIVDAYPKATWRGGAEVQDDPDPEVDTPFEDDFNEINRRLNLWSIFSRADILAGLGRYSVILIGAMGAPDQELTRIGGPEGLLFLMPFDEGEASILEWEQNTEDPRFGLPLMYQLSRKSKAGNFSKKVHWSRVIHVADGLLSDEIFGTPKLEKVWNRLDDLDKVVGGGSEAFWMRVHKGLVFSIDKDVKISPEDKAKLKEEAEEFVHQIRRSIAARGFDVKDLGSDVADFSKQVNSLIALISGATGIPQRILLGSERGELASSQDKENWNERVSDRRRDFAEPLVRDLVDKLIEYGAVAKPREDKYEILWPELEDLNETEKANVADKWSKLNKQAGGIVVTPAEIRDKVLRLEKLDPKIEEELIGEVKTETQPTEPGPNPPAQEGVGNDGGAAEEGNAGAQVGEGE